MKNINRKDSNSLCELEHSTKYEDDQPGFLIADEFTVSRVFTVVVAVEVVD